MNATRTYLGPFRATSWSPYVVGAGIGVLSWFAFLTADHPLGITTAFEHTAALLEQAFLPQIARDNTYFREETPKIGWEWMLVIGVFFGSLLSAWASGDRTRLMIPALWNWRFGDRVWVRFVGAFLGGALMMFGARLAHGCTSGHGISGTLQLAASSWLFAAVFFPIAITTALLMYGREGRKHV